ncbi:MAG TPA: LysR family transcriptional regulator [Opitutaceae bacterium]|nr:LysR family transcriptional regulator [Opitutaceae bacterium]
MSGRLAKLEPRLRFPAAIEPRFGPGKAELLRNISRTGSIAKSAARMGMSYNRAWILVRDMNRLFRDPLVAAARGGSAGGGASLTPAGRDVVARYARMEAACRKATRADWEALRRMLRA